MAAVWEDFDPLSDKPKASRQPSQPLTHLVAAQQSNGYQQQGFVQQQNPFMGQQPQQQIQQGDAFGNPFADPPAAAAAAAAAPKKKKVVKKKKAPVEDVAAKSSTPTLSRPTSASKAGKWNCSACTYENGAAASKCEICETPKPAGAGAGMAAVTAQMAKTTVTKPKKKKKQESSDEEESSNDSSDDDDDSSDEEEQKKVKKTKTTKLGADGKTKTVTTTTKIKKTKADKGYVPPNGKCCITGCAQPHVSQGYCQMHLKNPNAPITRTKHPDMWQIHFSKTSTNMGFNKNAVVWKFWHKGECHEVELFHSTFGGKRTVKVNGVLVLTEKKLVDNGSKYKFEVGSTDLAHAIITVEIKVVGISFTYELYIQDRPFEEARAYWLKNPEF